MPDRKSSVNLEDDPEGTQKKVQDDPDQDPNAPTGRAGETPEEKTEREEAERQAREEKDKEYKAAYTKYTTHLKSLEEDAERAGVPLADYMREVQRLAHLGYDYEQKKGKGSDGDKPEVEDKEFEEQLQELAEELGIDAKKFKPLVTLANSLAEKRIMEKLEPQFQRNLGLDLDNKYSQFLAYRKGKDPNFAITEDMKPKINARVAVLVKDDPARYDGKGAKNVYNRAFLDLIDDDEAFVEKVIAAKKASHEKREKDKNLLNVDRGKPGIPGSAQEGLADKIKGTLFPQANKRKKERG